MSGEGNDDDDGDDDDDGFRKDFIYHDVDDDGFRKDSIYQSIKTMTMTAFERVLFIKAAATRVNQ